MGEVCCILGVCCPPAAQIDALAAVMMEYLKCSEDEAHKHAAFMVKHWDLAPKDSVTPGLKVIFEMGRHQHHETT